MPFQFSFKYHLVDFLTYFLRMTQIGRANGHYIKQNLHLINSVEITCWSVQLQYRITDHSEGGKSYYSPLNSLSTKLMDTRERRIKLKLLDSTENSAWCKAVLSSHSVKDCKW